MLVEQLKEYIPVDIYGACARLKCPRSNKACDKLIENYKFYLSFENSLCDDYISEKSVKALNMLSVPIVYGAGNYSAYLPKHSFIDIRDFSSPKNLASYLLKLSADDKLYSEYFNWRKVYDCGFYRQNFDCDLCKYLWTHEGEQHILKRPDTFWGINENCHGPKFK